LKKKGIDNIPWFSSGTSAAGEVIVGSAAIGSESELVAFKGATDKSRLELGRGADGNIKSAYCISIEKKI